MTKSKTTILRIPTTNVFGRGDYSATLHLGSEKSPVNLLLDTGSSTLVVKNSAYQANLDKKLTASSAVQEVNYGVGGWNGPVVYTSINIHEHCHESEHPQSIAENPSMDLSNAPVAVVHSAKQSKTFGDADGILGLAYHHLNKSFDFSVYFAEHNITPALSYPWPFSDEISEDLASFKKLMWKYPEHDVTPYFTLLEQQQLSANKFAFYSKRSAIHINADNTEKTSADELAKDKLNQGLLILGGGEEQSDLYQGEFQNLKVEHDVYYNVELKSVQVGISKPITAAPLEPKKLKTYFTNAIIDTGAGGIVLTADIYQQVISDLITYNANFAECLAPFKEISAQLTGIDASELKLSEWPSIYFNFVSEPATTTKAEKIVQLACTPETYWQINTPNYGKACFRLLSQLPQWPNQSIIGLPLLNNYYVVFDRTKDKTGVVKFAKQQ
ncbi:pepsin-like aspartic protease [Colwellia psychrerythraea]|uniref:Peptidase A1 pepsin n=1 Tax=Colwellia psychrerythraea TaxID=28229 RepID=A0A099KH74_COLPS|nr:pepsin-like aspartic protease [Colwellia psychrerythraea]KGJ89686.1 Peptidase A1 pepsin [Colwellia psychrerythraea]